MKLMFFVWMAVGLCLCPPPSAAVSVEVAAKGVKSLQTKQIPDWDYSKEVFRSLKYFRCEEFNSPDVGRGCERMDWEFLYLLEQARERAQIPFVVSGGFRTKAHNAAVGGVTNSCHLYGYCADIRVSNASERYKIVEAAIYVGIPRIGVYSQHIHLCADPAKAQHILWMGEYKQKS
ncbi:MAG: D-Ala-D-Ala carboxypeptidase family metallohydrolase [Chitinophagales bacterium]